MRLDMDDRRAPYLQVADALRTSIRQGTYAPGERLPTVSELADEYGVAKMTIQRAIAVLRDEGLAMSWQGRGTFVRDQGQDKISTQAVDGPYAAIMTRLDEMYDELQRLDERVAQLENTDHPRQSKPTNRHVD